MNGFIKEVFQTLYINHVLHFNVRLTWIIDLLSVCVCLCVCVRACVRACVCTCVCVCVVSLFRFDF